MPTYYRDLGFDSFAERRIISDLPPLETPNLSSLEGSDIISGLNLGNGDSFEGGNLSQTINSGNLGDILNDKAISFDKLDLVIGQGVNTVGMSGTGAESTSIRIWAGETFGNRGSAPFRVTAAGAVTASAIAIIGGDVGGWVITATTLYGLASGTPTVAPSDGIVMTSGATANIAIYEDTEQRIVIGNLSAGVYGIRGYATDGTTTLFELSDTQNVIAGWVITDGYIYNLQSGTPTAAPNDGIVLASGDEGIIVYEDTAERVRVGFISAGIYGIRGFATNGTTVIFEFSDTRQVIGGWNFTDTVLRTGATDAASNVLIDSANSLFRLGPTTGASITMDGANQRIRSSTYVSGVSGFNVDPTLIEAQNILARGTMSGTVFRYDVISATGGRQIIANADALSTAMTALDASTLTIRGNITLAVNDILIIRAQSAGGIQEEYLRVTVIGAAPTYTVTRDLLGTYAADTNPAWPAGTVVVQQGVSDGAAAFSGGWLELVGEASAGVDWPRISVIQRTAIAADNRTERVRIGNLNGYLGYVADTFGVGMGSSAAGEANITIDPTNGIRIRQGTTNRISLDMAGAATLFALNVEGSLNIFTSGNLRSGQTAYNTGTGYFMEYNAGTPRFSIGDATAGNSLTWDGTTLRVNNRTLDGYDLFGDGNDGDVTIAGNTTLTRDMFYENLTVNAGVVLSTAGYRVFARTSATVNGTIRNNGSNGSVGGDAALSVAGTGGAGGAGGTGNILTAGLVGVTGGTGATGIGGAGGGTSSAAGAGGTALTAGGLGGAGQSGVVGGTSGDATGGGGTGGGQAGGAGGATGAYTAAVSAPRAIPMVTNFHYTLNDGTTVFFNGRSGNGASSGGSSGGSTVNSTSGGGGGAGGVGGNGGVVFLSSLSITIGAAGRIEALGGTGGNGGNGGNASGAGAGAGGGGTGAGGDGGNGGVVGLIYSSLTNNGIISVAGGSGGSAGVTGGSPQGAGNFGATGAAGSTGLAGVRIDIIT